MLSEKLLRTAAKELNEVLTLDPPFDAKSDLKDLADEIKSVVNDPNCIQPGDTFTEGTQTVIDELRESKKKTTRTVSTPKKEEVEEEEEEDVSEKAAAKMADKLSKQPVNAGKKPTRIIVEEEPEEDEPEVEEEKPVKKAGKAVAVKEPKAKKEKKERQPSPYGTAVEIMCKDYTTSKESLYKQLTKKGIDIEAGKAGILTAHSVVQKIVSLLRENNHIKD